MAFGHPDSPAPASDPFGYVGLTYDDVLLLPGETDVIPSEVDTTTRLTREISVAIPLVSAAMDTVTESRMAITMARQGGVGILHRNLSIDDQAHQVDLVKRSESGMITDPVTVGPEATLAELDELCGKYRVSGLPVVEESGRLLGIITNRDLRFVAASDYPVLRVREVMTPMPLVTAPVGIAREDAAALLAKHKVEKLPLVDPDGMLRGLITVKDFVKSEQYPLATKDGEGRLVVGAAVGFFGDAWDRALALVVRLTTHTPGATGVTAVREVVRQRLGQALVAPVGRGLLVVAGVRSSVAASLRPTLHDLVDALDAELSATTGGHVLHVTSAGVVDDLAGLARAVPVTLEAAELGESLGLGSRVLLTHDLGVYHVLSSVVGDAELERFVADQLGPLLDRDAHAGSDLVQTLDAYLEAGLSKTAAAAALGLRRQTLYSRLEQISRHLGGLDLTDRRRRTALDLALAAWRLRTTGAARMRPAARVSGHDRPWRRGFGGPEPPCPLVLRTRSRRGPRFDYEKG